jgi:hypothetical protein
MDRPYEALARAIALEVIAYQTGNSRAHTERELARERTVAPFWHDLAEIALLAPRINVAEAARVIRTLHRSKKGTR